MATNCVAKFAKFDDTLIRHTRMIAISISEDEMTLLISLHCLKLGNIQSSNAGVYKVRM